jgi:hypothetical protein
VAGEVDEDIDAVLADEGLQRVVARGRDVAPAVRGLPDPRCRVIG